MVTIKEHNQRYLEAMYYIMDTRGLNRDSFAETVGVAGSLLSHIKKGKQNASLDLITKTVAEYPEINADYIIIGREPMLMTGEDKKSSESENESTLLKLQEELREAYMEIGELRMKLKAAEEHKTSQKIG